MSERIVSIHAFYESETGGVGLDGQVGGVDAFLSRPLTLGPWPAVIVLHEWWGLDERTRELTRRFAREGYVALAPDLFHGKLTTDPTEAASLKIALDINQAIQETSDAIPYLKTLPWVKPDRIGIIGFCMGGGIALFAACRSLHLSAAVIYYHSIYPDPVEIEGISCPLLGHYGTADQITPLSEVKAFRNALEKYQKNHEIHLYESANHAYCNEAHKFYNPEAAETSWSRTVAFFQKHLKG